MELFFKLGSHSLSVYRETDEIFRHRENSGIKKVLEHILGNGKRSHSIVEKPFEPVEG